MGPQAVAQAPPVSLASCLQAFEQLQPAQSLNISMVNRHLLFGLRSTTWTVCQVHTVIVEGSITICKVVLLIPVQSHTKDGSP
eukprot:SAG31_NODE_32177_length_359_cov_0.650000_1_plen_82_part_01